MERAGPRAWIIALGIVVLAFAGTVLTLNLTLYSASGFVSSYLNALARHDVAGALATPGVTLPGSGSRELLRADALGGLDDIRLVSDTDSGGGVHRLVYSYRSAGQSGTTSFTVEHTGPRLGLFSGWRFTRRPVSVLRVTPLHGDSFTANGLTLTAKGGIGSSTDYLVLAPSRFALAFRSPYFVAPTTSVLVQRVGGTVPAAVDIQASPAFVREVQKQLDAYLAACVTQKVLLPTGCPMGQQITDRIQDAPTWSMVANPRVTIRPGDAPGEWLMPPTEGTAHLKVTVKSIFDGTVSTFDQDVPFSVSYVITFQSDGTLRITAQ